ncbi:MULTISPECIES: CpaF family protein [Pseudobutyrivibrio]|uniref:Pilus assembly protein CpaF n=1 Tax=Pseudobutyrivibrio xylanivorans TaxID=185007 RepID=A0A1G5RXU6_PSEXY|nr:MULTISPECIES: CpaF family protein [Pseudobutyrivibrio]MDC7279341.1 CpaF family protein [Butyrivibrio fibrisolvens]SCZ78863.1 pilus assembly protein CpaF [Pseudobutyrivibrio xylanivorans]
MANIEEQVRIEVMNEIDLSYDVTDEEILKLIKEKIMEKSKSFPISLSQRQTIENHVFNSLRKLDVLEDLLADEEITEIMINGPDNIFIEKNGQVIHSDEKFSSEEKLNDIIQSIVAQSNKIVNESNPIVDSRLPDGSRINIVLKPAAVDHSILSIRKFPKEQMTMERLKNFGSIDEEQIDFLKKLVESGYNIFVSGGTGSGKTSFLNALGEFIPKDERVITIEDSAELQLKNVENLVRLEARNANLEGKNEISIRDLLKSSLRMRPDRIVVGECRGAEALEMLQAFNTGHDGSLSTGHSNSCKDMLSRLETMVLMGAEIPLPAIRQQIASGIDIIVQLGRLRDKSRKLLEISEVAGIEAGEIKLNPLYRFREINEENGRIKGQWEKVGSLMHTEKLLASGKA